MRRPRSFVAAGCVMGGLCVGRCAAAQTEWRPVGDPTVLDAMHVRAAMAFGFAGFVYPSPYVPDLTYKAYGVGLNVEEAFGLPRGLEFGARFGFRLDDAGRSLRADEIARGIDTETFGTGTSSYAANPELRVRWKALSWQRIGDAGLEARAVFPVKEDPFWTGLLAAWGALRPTRWLRVDATLVGALELLHFQSGLVEAPAFGVSLQAMAAVAPRLSLALFGAFNDVAETIYTPVDAHLIAGVALGYRLGPFDIVGTGELPDLKQSGFDRFGFSLGIAIGL